MSRLHPVMEFELWYRSIVLKLCEQPFQRKYKLAATKQLKQPMELKQ